MLPESRLFNFIDSKNGYTLSFFEGQKVIHDLAIIHNVKNQGFNFFRNAILSSIPLINFLKPSENLGLFIDSENPYFKLKVEMNSSGLMRTLLMPEHFDELPPAFSGKVRLVKQFPTSPTPYTTILEINAQSMNEVINTILKDSYQVNSRVLLSDSSDQSVLVSRLPDKNVDKELVDDRVNLHDYIEELKPDLVNFFQKVSEDESEIQGFFTDHGFDLLMSKEVKFKCNCSRERMVSGIAGLVRTHDIENVFEGKESLEAKCDYCNTEYLITKDEIKSLTTLN